MKIILFLNNDIHAATALNHLLPTLKKHNFKIVLSQKVGNVSALPPELIKMGQIEKDGVGKLLGEVKNALKGQPHNKNEVTKTPTNRQEFHEKHITSYPNINADEALNDFKNFAADLFISIRFGQIFKQPLITIPRYGVLNLHSGILPDYRGVIASFWTILSGAKKLGTTLHYISDSSIDTGEIISFSEKAIDRESSLLLNINNLYRDGCALIAQTVENISSGKEIPTIDQKTLGNGGYFSYPKEEDVKKFLTLMPLTKDGDLEIILKNLL